MPDEPTRPHQQQPDPYAQSAPDYQHPPPPPSAAPPSPGRRPLIAQQYSNTIFLTYNRDSQDSLLPDLPKMYIHSFKPKVSEKPWFALSEVEGA